MWKVVTAVIFFFCCHVASAALYVVEEEEFQIRSYSALEKILRQSVQNGNNQGFNQSESNSCSCTGYTCGCCLHLEVEKIHLNDTACVNISYLPKEYGLELDVILDGHVVFREKVSAKNPPPICGGIPYIHKLASLCIRFYNLSVSTSQFSGCVDFEVELEGVVIKKFHLGCFRIPPGSLSLRQVLEAHKAAKRWRELSLNQIKQVEP